MKTGIPAARDADTGSQETDRRDVPINIFGYEAGKVFYPRLCIPLPLSNAPFLDRREVGIASKFFHDFFTIVASDAVKIRINHIKSRKIILRLN